MAITGSYIRSCDTNSAMGIQIEHTATQPAHYNAAG